MSPKARRKPLLGGPGTPLSPLPYTTDADEKPGQKASLWPLLLLALYLAAASAHAWMVPVGQTGYQNAPDEAAHVNYIRVLAAGHLPTQSDEAADPRRQSYEWHQPPLYYALALPALSGGVHALRLISIGCGVLCILLIFRIARLVFPQSPLIAIVATGIAALTPGHIAITSTVNNDALVEACFSAALLALLTALRSGFTLWRAGWLGAALGAALLTKATGLLLIPIIAIALLLYVRSGERLSKVLQGAAWCFAIAFCLCGWWYARNALLYHEWLPLRAFEQSFRGTAQAADVVSGRIPIRLPTEGWTGYWLLVGTMSFDSFWAVYGTPRFAAQGIPAFLPDQLYYLMAVVVVAAIAGLIRLHFSRQEEVTETQTRAIWLLFASLGIVALAFIRFLAHYFQTQGRYLYPTMASVSILIALGWCTLFPPKYRNIAAGLLLTVLGVLTLIFLTAVQTATQ